MHFLLGPLRVKVFSLSIFYSVRNQSHHLYRLSLRFSLSVPVCGVLLFFQLLRVMTDPVVAERDQNIFNVVVLVGMK